jgi:hypothetical protein
MGEGWSLMAEGLEFTHTGTHLTQPVEDPIQDYEEWQNLHYGEDSTADDEAEDGPQDESESHGLPAADFVHQQSSEDAAREIENVDGSTEADSLNQLALRVQSGYNGRTEDAERIDLCRAVSQHER